MNFLFCYRAMCTPYRYTNKCARQYTGTVEHLLFVCNHVPVQNSSIAQRFLPFSFSSLAQHSCMQSSRKIRPDRKLMQMKGLIPLSPFMIDVTLSLILILNGYTVHIVYAKTLITFLVAPTLKRIPNKGK